MREALFVALVLGLLAALSARADIILKDEGTTKGPVIVLDCDGGLVCTRTGSEGTLTAP